MTPVDFRGKWRLRNSDLADVIRRHEDFKPWPFSGNIYRADGSIIPSLWDALGNNAQGNEWDLMKRFTGERADEFFAAALRRKIK